jgi:TctA family transporter
MLSVMGKAIALLCLAGGVAVCAASLGLLPQEYLAFEAPRWAVFGAGVLSVLVGFMLLARDHRASDALASILLLALAAIAGWITFYAPEGTIQRFLPFIPADVNDALGRLLFGLGAVACVGLAIWALRRLFR